MIRKHHELRCPYTCPVFPHEPHAPKESCNARDRDQYEGRSAGISGDRSEGEGKGLALARLIREGDQAGAEVASREKGDRHNGRSHLVCTSLRGLDIQVEGGCPLHGYVEGR